MVGIFRTVRDVINKVHTDSGAKNRTRNAAYLHLKIFLKIRSSFLTVSRSGSFMPIIYIKKRNIKKSGLGIG